MNVRLQIRIVAALFGDIFFFYLSLGVVLAMRLGGQLDLPSILSHILPFSIIGFFWFLIFYIAGLYDISRMRNTFNFFSNLFTVLAINISLAVVFFYLFPGFGISPKTTLAGFAIVFFISSTLWRRWLNRYASQHAEKIPIFFVSQSPITDFIAQSIRKNPQLGYVVTSGEDSSLNDFISNKNGIIIIPSHHTLENPHTLLTAISHGVVVQSESMFCEFLFRIVPLLSITPAWFYEHSLATPTLYDKLKRSGEFFMALVIQILIFPLELIIGLIILITSPGPIIYTQLRVGKHNHIFRLYKFRTMRIDAEKDGVQWSSGRHDPRVTFFGKFLRHSHLDELPQLINILRGEISFVGPRPERPEIVPSLISQVPFYEVRYSISPGITGWAQINFKKDSSIDDVKKKLEYDLYYIKHRSFIFDLAIVLRTIKSLFVNE